ncbi:MAG: hypothetical protein ACXW2I_00105 [Burkholderiales bacterium]
MGDVPLHRLYLHYSELPYSIRVLYTAVLLVLGLAYVFAGIYLYHTYAGRAGGNAMLLTYDDVVVAYRGSGQGSRLEAALRGPMRTMLPADEIGPITKWVQDGADRLKYEQQVRPLLEKRCYSCHDGSNPHLANLSGYDNVKKVAERDTGTDIFTLVRVSHIHLFGLTMVFFILGVIFSHAYVRPVWLKCTVIALPFLCLTLDIVSWYITKLFAPFAAVVMLAGALMAFAFAFMWVVSFYQLWFSPPPAPVAERTQPDARVVA